MKLIFCPKCYDVLRLIPRMRFCDCKQSSGIVEKDGLNSKMFGEAVPLWFSNESFIEALYSRPTIGMGNRFDAFIIAYSCPTINSGNVDNYKISNDENP